MQEIGHVFECDFSNQEFEEFASLARMSIEHADRNLSIDYPEPSWNPLTKRHTSKTETSLNEHRTRYLTAIKLNPVKDGSPVVAVDVSILGLGETQSGTIYAIRGTAVSRKDGRYQYSRLGPFLFHINGDNNRNIDGTPTVRYPIPSVDARKLGGPYVYRGLLTVFETMLREKVAKKYSGAIVLWDGSLSILAMEEEIRANRLLLELARERGNRIVGLSKKTYLFSPQGTKDPLRKHAGPCLIDIDCAVQRTRRLLLLGRVYVAKLARNGLSFRLDVDKEIPKAERISTVEKMIGNDLTRDGYPETLRLAHIFSKFNATEVIGMHRFLDENYGLRVLEYPSIRQILFGPFAGPHSKEPDANHVKPV